MPHRLFRFSLLVVVALVGPAASARPAEPQVARLRARHQTGQTLLTFAEVASPVSSETIRATELQELRRTATRDGRVRYRVYRSEAPLKSLDGLKPIAELPPLTGWNIDYYGSLRPEHVALRYVVDEGREPVPPGTGICAYNPPQAGPAYYAVTVVTDGRENTALTAENSLAKPVAESVGLGVPVLQRTVRPAEFQYVKQPTLHYYVRWESPPNCAVQGKPIDYLVGIPPNPARPAPVGIHLHCWGGSLDGGYGWWYQAEQGHLLLASNQIPYDWWTGYHERYWDGPAEQATWKDGVVRPYSQRRLLSFLEWLATRQEIDLTRTHVAGNSMGGSGAPMFAIRHPERIAWAASWVGVHVPRQSPTFANSYANVYGKPEWNVAFEDGTPAWDYFDDTWYLRKYPGKEVGLIAFSNGKNDGGIGWPQAAAFHRALQETRRPHVFVWGQSGHGQRAQMPRSLSDRYMPLDLRTDQSQPAFTGCSLDDDPGGGDPKDGAPAGQSNLYLDWESADIVDQAGQWQMTVGLLDKAPQDGCTVNVTPRRVQRFRPPAGTQVQWSSTSLRDPPAVQSGRVVVDALGLVTLPQVRVDKGKNRLRVWWEGAGRK